MKAASVLEIVRSLHVLGITADKVANNVADGFDELDQRLKAKDRVRRELSWLDDLVNSYAQNVEPSMSRDAGKLADWSNAFDRLETFAGMATGSEFSQAILMTVVIGRELIQRNEELEAEIAGIRTQLRQDIRSKLKGA
jgi:hypothetical protein